MRASLSSSSTRVARRAAAAPPPALAPPRTITTTSSRGRRRAGRMASDNAAAAADASSPPPSSGGAAAERPPATATTATTPAPAPIPRREVALLRPAPRGPPAIVATDLRVLTWNVLADGLAQNGGWTHLPSPAAPALSWPRRFPALVAAVAASGADLVCLQECNRFAEDWRPAMRALGYEGAHWQKPRSPCERYGADRDGLALFWRKGRLRLAGKGDGGGAAAAAGAPPPFFFAGPFRHLAPSPAALATLEDGEDDADAAPAAPAPEADMQLQAASQGMIVAVLEEEEEGEGEGTEAGGGAGGEAAGAAAAATPAKPGRRRRLVVAVTHLKAKEGFEARRREQAAQLCQRVRATLSALSSESGGGGDGNDDDADGGGDTTAVLVAGDFNAPPDSAAAELVRAPALEGGLGLRCLWDVPLAAAAASPGEAAAAAPGGAAAAAGGNGKRPEQQQPQPQQQQQQQGQAAAEDLLFTTWKFRGDGGGAREKLETIDHIFFGCGADAAVAIDEQQDRSSSLQLPSRTPPPLVAVARWASLSREEIGCAALPCDNYPSDHVAVLCRFAWRR